MARKSGFGEAPQKPLRGRDAAGKSYKTSRGTSMGGLGTAKERAAAGLNPVPGIDMSFAEAEAFLAQDLPVARAPRPSGGRERPAPIAADAVTATVEALSA